MRKTAGFSAAFRTCRRRDQGRISGRGTLDHAARNARAWCRRCRCGLMRPEVGIAPAWPRQTIADITAAPRRGGLEVAGICASDGLSFSLD